MKKLFLLLLLTFGFAVPAFSQMMDMPMMEHRDKNERMTGMDNMMGMCIKHADKLGLSDDQIVKIKHAHRDMQKKQIRFKADLKIAKIELMEIIEVKDFDMEKASAAVNKIDGIKTANYMEMLKSMKDMRNNFTDEQFKKMQMMSMKNNDKKPEMKRMMKLKQ